MQSKLSATVSLQVPPASHLMLEKVGFSVGDKFLLWLPPGLQTFLLQIGGAWDYLMSWALFFQKANRQT